MDASIQGPVLVTGGTGFVGSHLVERLTGLGVRVRCLVRRSSSLQYLPAGKVELVYGELAAGEGLEEAVGGMATVFHVAGVTKALSRAAYFQGNLHGTQNLVRACQARGGALPRFVHVSSLAAVGPSPDGAPLDEDAAPHPLTWYGESKLQAEEAVRASALGRHAVILRPPVVYGPRDTDVLEVFRSVARGVMVRIGRGESHFSYLHVSDLAEALVRAACSEAAPGRTYFVANPEPASWSEFAAAAARVMGRRLRTVTIPFRVAYAFGWLAEAGSRRRRKPNIISRQKVLEARCRYWICDVARARAELGFRTRKPLGEGVAETLAWYKDAGWLKY
ncbi:MAG: NAD-dependent epimerase/dehydratase family protein [Bryobacteraceae bacterium]|jgi:nucleoside-diphosphate-sugar epimerase